MTRKLAAALCALAVLGVGCGDDDEGGTGEPEQSAPADNGPDGHAHSPDPADLAIADASLLTLDDFPAGWEAQPAEDDGDDRESQTRIAECVGVDYEDLYSGDSGASAESPTFVSGNDEEISSTVKVATDERWAANAFEIAAQPKFRECLLEETTTAVEEAAAGEDFEFGDPSINEISFDDYGDGTLAFRLTIPVEAEGFSLEVTTDFILVRVGRAQTTVSAQSTGSPFDVAELSALMKVAADRLTQELR
jgi:hypothetical protein